MEEKRPYTFADGILVASKFFKSPDAPHYATEHVRRLEIEIGEAVTMTCPGVGIGRWRLERKPPGSGAELADNKLVWVDRPGLHRVRLEVPGRWFHVIELCAYTNFQLFGNGPKSEERRHQARGWLNDPNRTPDEVIDRLEMK